MTALKYALVGVAAGVWFGALLFASIQVQRYLLEVVP